MAFERDLGYLDKFFDGLEAHAGSLQGDAGGRLKALIAEERQRWTEIRSLLGGGGGAPSTTKKSGGAEARPSDDDKPAAKPAPKAPPALTAGAPSGAKSDVTAPATKLPSSGFTVGSLRGR